ncbi:MAG: ABC transporter substrate-binding protein [Candidatus Odyssella sp.]|nr:ABC transporter substrate-binding protein [Candidatus Odyssella sp.]
MTVRTWTFPAAVTAALAATAFFGGPAIGVAAAQEAKKITVVMDWIAKEPQHMAYWIARERGWYKEAGLDVTIQGGRGSVQVIQLLLSGQAQFGNVAATSLTQAVAKQNADVKMLAVFAPRDLLSVAVLQSSGIRSLKDFEGRSLGVVPGTLQDTILAAWGEAAGFDAGKIRKIHTEFRLVYPQWIAGQFHINGNFSIGTAILAEQVRAKGDRIVNFVLSDHLPLIGHGIAAANATLTKDPQAAKAFVAATRRAWEYMLKEPRAAVTEAAEIIRKNVEAPPAAEDIIANALQAVPAFMQTAESKDKPVGWSDPKRWQAMIDVLAKHDNFPRKPAVSELVTYDYLQ